MIILQVAPGEAAANAGLRGVTQTENGDFEIGDIIVGMDSDKIDDSDDLYRLLDKHQVGDTVQLQIFRNGSADDGSGAFDGRREYEPASQSTAVRTGDRGSGAGGRRTILISDFWPLAPNLRPLISMNQTNHFFNLGYGWLCKHCSAAEAERKHSPSQSKNQDTARPKLALASWTDAERNALICPNCGIQEMVR